jgi:hypothetical protein
MTSQKNFLCRPAKIQWNTPFCVWANPSMICEKEDFIVLEKQQPIEQTSVNIISQPPPT